MKSAYELAMEKLGGQLHDYSNEQKEQLAEVDKIYDAKEAQAKFDAQRRLQEAATDPTKIQQIQEDLNVELASVESRRERQKKELRQTFKGDAS